MKSILALLFRISTATLAFIVFIANLIKAPINTETILNWLPFSISDHWARFLLGLLLLVYLIFILKGIKLKDISNLLVSFRYFLPFGEIAWLERENVLNFIAYKPTNIYLLGHFSLKGKSKKSYPIEVKEAYLQSLINGETLPIFLNDVTAKGSIIQPKALFNATCGFPNNGGEAANNSIKGMTFDSFKNRFSSFQFILKTNKSTYQFEFDKKFTGDYINSIITGLQFPPASNDKASILPAPKIQ